MTIIINGSGIDLSTGWLIVLGVIGFVIVLTIVLFIGVVWQAAAAASDWFEEERRRRTSGGTTS